MSGSGNPRVMPITLDGLIHATADERCSEGGMDTRRFTNIDDDGRCLGSKTHIIYSDFSDGAFGVCERCAEFYFGGVSVRDAVARCRDLVAQLAKDAKRRA